eukprot:10481267-Alexandrium_andersonii.AAC.1
MAIQARSGKSTSVASVSICTEQQARKDRDSARDSARERPPAIRAIQPWTESRDPGPPVGSRSA